MLACRTRNKDLAELLLENLANPDNVDQNDDDDFERDTLLTIAADLRDTQLVESILGFGILGFGANMNLTNKERQNALMIAYRSDNISLVLALIKHQSWVLGIMILGIDKVFQSKALNTSNKTHSSN